MFKKKSINKYCSELDLPLDHVSSFCTCTTGSGEPKKGKEDTETNGRRTGILLEKNLYLKLSPFFIKDTQRAGTDLKFLNLNE